MAVFMDRGRSTTLYFSPAAAAFAERFESVSRCPAPNVADLAHYAGDERALKIVFGND